MLNVQTWHLKHVEVKGSINLQYSTPTNLLIHHKPFLHCTHAEAIASKSCLQLHKYLMQNIEWDVDSDSDDDKNNLVYFPVDGVQEHIKRLFAKYTNTKWLQHLGDMLQCDIPLSTHNLYILSIRKSGAYTPMHTDANHYNKFSNKLGVSVKHSIAQHIYIAPSNNISEFGMILHDIDGKPCKQIPCTLGSYVAYQNTDISLHSVPVQNHNDDRILLTIRTFY